MIHVRNNAASTTPVAVAAAGAIVPFDTTALATNTNLTLNDNKIEANAVGIYDTKCTVTMNNAGTSLATATIQLYADGKAVAGATAVCSIPASGTTTATLIWPVNVVAANTGTAKINWFISGAAVSLSNAFAQMSKYI